jgi:hypothetical protein
MNYVRERAMDDGAIVLKGGGEAAPAAYGVPDHRVCKPVQVLFVPFLRTG